MSILDWIEKLRHRPEIERRRILVGSTFVITGVIFLIWLSIRLYGFEDGNKAVVTKKDSGPMKELFNTINKFSENIKENVSSIKNVLNSATTSMTSSSSDTLEP